ncbi:MAG: 2-C-methyl-D-erythritol 4-phosphate cytidylyltransferase [Lachnospiraceae bacterium]|nr:2-C-methyl-D-erythritol 4-phosphate cytidylyltransferase [Lachnospiraceae bacterium]
MNYALLLSGGTGARAGFEIPKQYVHADGHMMVTYALMPLLRCEKIDAVYIVAEREWRNDIWTDAENAGSVISKIVAYADAGESRQMSILNGMDEIMRDIGERAEDSKVGEGDTILIHDAARPFLSDQLLQDCYEALEGHDGVLPVLPMKDTVYISESGITVSSLIQRSTVYAGQAPELFRFKKYYSANRKLLPNAINDVCGASEPAILNGMDVVMIRGDEENFKVTTAADMLRFKNRYEV